MSAFDAAIEALLAHEGGYVSAERAREIGDRGGETNWGLSKATYPDLDLKRVTRDQAIAIYRRDFWDRLRCGDMPAPIARMVFDTAVNHGQGDAARFLQRALGVKDDGAIGPKTIAALLRAQPETVIREFFVQRAIDYGDTRRETWNANKKGWMRRLMDEHRAAVLAP